MAHFFVCLIFINKMVIEEVRKNKSAKRPNFHKGSLSHSPSQTNGDAKVQINSEIAIPKLQKLAGTYFGVSDPHRFFDRFKDCIRHS